MNSILLSICRKILLVLLDDRQVLERIIVAVEPRLWQLAEHKKGFDEHHQLMVVPTPGKDPYTVFQVDRPATTWAFLDFTNSHAGDQYRVELLVAIGNAPFKRYESYIVEDQPTDPIATITGRFAPALRLTLAQTRGISREIPVEIFTRYED